MKRNGGKMADAAKAWHEHKQSGGHYARKDGTVPISKSTPLRTCFLPIPNFVGQDLSTILPQQRRKLQGSSTSFLWPLLRTRGLLYHFSNKDALLQAMLQRRVERFERLKQEHLERLENDPNKEPKSILLAALDTDAECARLGSGMLAAAASNPDLLEPLKRHVNDTIKQMERHLGE